MEAGIIFPDNYDMYAKSLFKGKVQISKDNLNLEYEVYLPKVKNLEILIFTSNVKNHKFNFRIHNPYLVI